MGKTYHKNGPLRAKWLGAVRTGKAGPGAAYTNIREQLAMFARRFDPREAALLVGSNLAPPGVDELIFDGHR